MLNIENRLNDIKKRMIEDQSLPGLGWSELLIQLDSKLTMLDPDYKILQIKEKFGTLRFYYQTDTKIVAVKEAMDRYVRYAEMESSKICEECGQVGFLMSRRLGWMKTRCNNCAVANNNEVRDL